MRCLCLVALLMTSSVLTAREPLQLRPDPAKTAALPLRQPGSHLKVFLPSLPYLAISHSINGMLVRPSASPSGWDFELATSMREVSPTEIEFELRQGVRFQDGSVFDADSVLMNMGYFKKRPFTYSAMHLVFVRATKVSQHRVRFILRQAHGSLVNDLMYLPFYTESYLKKHGWNGKATAANLAEPGPFGLGPFILEAGFIEGDRHTAKAELRANPYYWDKRYPKVERITVFTELKSQEARDMVLRKEGELDLAVIYPEDKIQTILAPFSKLVTSRSTDNVSVHFNMLSPTNQHLRNVEVRRAINAVIDQEMLLRYAFEGEGIHSVATASPVFPGISQIQQEFSKFSRSVAKTPADLERLNKLLQGQTFSVLTQQRFLPLWRGIESALGRFGAKLNLDVRLSETDIFEQLLATRKGENTIRWDFLVWGNDDWYCNHPWSAFFVYRSTDNWSTITSDPRLDALIGQIFRYPPERPEFVDIVRKIAQRAYDQAYMLFVPTPNKVFAVNKEVSFSPYKCACIPLWEMGATANHWSLRQGAYPEALKFPVEVTRVNFNSGKNP